MIINKVTSTIICLIYISVITATVITVDNRMPSIGDYTSIQSAHDAASDTGATLLVYPSKTSYSTLTVTKPLHIIGPGHREVSGYSSSETATIGTITFQEGSEGAVLEGFVSNDPVFIFANDITIKNNYFHKNNRMLYIGTSGYLVENTIIQGNKIIGSSYNYELVSIGTAVNAAFTNNIIIR